MVVGSFFNSVGEELLKIILEGDVGNIRDYLKISDEWNDKTYEETKKLLMNYDCNIDIEKLIYISLKIY